MKQLYLLPLLLLPTVALFAQEKFELGFAVKAGTFTMPVSRQASASIEHIFSPGTSTSFGIFATRWLGSHFGLSAELLYNFSAYQLREVGTDYSSSFFSIPYFQSEMRINNFETQSFMAPINLYFSPKKSGKIAVNVGVAFGHVFSSHQIRTYEVAAGSTLTERKKGRVKAGAEERPFRVFVSAGGRYRVTNTTSIGLEYVGTLRHDAPLASPDLLILSKALIETSFGQYPFWMQSLAISLRHNILRQ